MAGRYKRTSLHRMDTNRGSAWEFMHLGSVIQSPCIVFDISASRFLARLISFFALFAAAVVVFDRSDTFSNVIGAHSGEVGSLRITGGTDPECG